MRLLITTQAVDLDDPVLGFFHRWLVEFAAHCESIHVICLKEGRHELPSNVFVHSLGKEAGRSRIKYITRFYRYIWRYRKEYDAVFVHMNCEYVVLGGLLWRSWGKKIALWYVHKKVTIRLRIATLFSHDVFTASRGSFRLETRKLHVIGHGIDTDVFTPASVEPKPGSILFLGRIDAVKRVEVFIGALQLLHDAGEVFSAEIVGNPTDPGSNYAHDVRNLAAPLALEGIISMREAVKNQEAADLFRSHSIYCNITPSGSFDKTILEAMASGCVCVVANEAFRNVLPDMLIARDDSERALADSLREALRLQGSARNDLAQRSRAWIKQQHSVSTMVEAICVQIASRLV